MEAQLEEQELTPEESQQASAHWDSLMFASSRVDTETARQLLGKASLRVQLAVMGNITKLWMQDYTPEPDENPFLPRVPFPEVQGEELAELKPLSELKAGTLQREQPTVGALLLFAVVRLCTTELPFLPREHLTHSNTSPRKAIGTTDEPPYKAQRIVPGLRP